MNVELIRQRIFAGEAYLQALECVLDGGWQRTYEEHKAGRTTIAESLALVHPLNIQGDQTGSCGPRQFREDPAHQFQICQCEIYWQVVCERREVQQLFADHVFPYSLGGPTVPENRMMLCGAHNRMKSNDIHLFPWERGLPVWFPSLLSRIESRRSLRGPP